MYEETADQILVCKDSTSNDECQQSLYRSLEELVNANTSISNLNILEHKLCKKTYLDCFKTPKGTNNSLQTPHILCN